MPIKINCLNCTKEFFVVPANKNRAKHCSKTCYTEYRQAGMIKKDCGHCGNLFTCPPSQIQAFCSSKCCHANRLAKSTEKKQSDKIRREKEKIERKHPLKRVTVICLFCKNPFSVMPSRAHYKYCSKDCRFGFFKVRRIRTCIKCGKEFSKYAPSENKKFCSKECYRSRNVSENLTKKCNKCEKDLPLESFRNNYKVCKPCKSLKILETKVSNPAELEKRVTKRTEIAKRKAFLLENPDLKWCDSGRHFVSKNDISPRKACKNCRKSQYEQNKDTISLKGKIYRKANRQKIREQRRKEYEQNKNYYKNLARQRKALLRGAKGKFTLKQWQDKLRYFGNRCYLCGGDLKDKITHLEHRKPISRNGTNWIANIAPACSDCNHSKNNKTEKEFREWREKQLNLAAL